MCNYPTAPGNNCDGFDYVGVGYPMKRCCQQAVTILTIKDATGFCYAKKLCEWHALKQMEGATVEVLAVEPMGQAA